MTCSNPWSRLTLSEYANLHCLRELLRRQLRAIVTRSSLIKPSRPVVRGSTYVITLQLFMVLSLDTVLSRKLHGHAFVITACSLLVCYCDKSLNIKCNLSQSYAKIYRLMYVRIHSLVRRLLWLMLQWCEQCATSGNAGISTTYIVIT